MITGEGRIDSQTLHGKAVKGVILAAEARKVPILVFGGGVEPDGYDLLQCSNVAILPIVNRPMSLAEAVSTAPDLLSRVAEQAARLLRFGSSPNAVHSA